MEKLAGSSPDVYIGRLISLTSKREIRYEGALHTLDTEKSLIVLEDVRSFGTEGRGTNILQIRPSSDIYEHIIFRNTDIKDLTVLPLPGNFEEFTNNVSGGENSNGDSLGTVLGLPVPLYSSHTQVFSNWWQCVFSPVASSSNTPPSSPISIVCKDACPEIAHSFPSLSLQGNHGPGVVPMFEQVSTIMSANVCNTQSSHLPQHLPDQNSTSAKGFISGHVIFQPRTRPEGQKSQIKPFKVQPLLEQPLLPLPVSESEHRRLIRESMCSANPEHLRRPKLRSRGRQRGGLLRQGAPSETHNEASSTVQQFSEEFDFEAMNEHFNKKELWHDLYLNDQQALTGDGNQDNTTENILNKCSPSRKLLFVEDFFDLLPSRDEDCEETRAQGTKFSRQRQIDLETFGIAARPRRGRRKGSRKKGVDTTSSDTERNGCC